MRDRTGILKPVIVAQLLVVMLLAGVGASFALNPHAVGPSATPGAGSFTIKFYEEVYDSANTQLIGIIVSVHNNDTVSHSGIVNVALEQGADSITGQGAITDLAGGATTQVTINLGPISRGTYKWSVIVTQTS